MLATPLFPHALGNGIVSPVLPLSNGSFPELTMGYFGIVGWAAAGLVLRPGSRRGARAWILFALIVVGCAAATAAWPVAEIVSVLPGIRYLFPVRFHAWESLAGPALAALELDRLARDGRERARETTRGRAASSSAPSRPPRCWPCWRCSSTSRSAAPTRSRELTRSRSRRGGSP